MSTPTTYTFTVNAEGTFYNRKVDVPRFTQEIAASPVITALDTIVIAGGNCLVTFKDALSAEDLAHLESVVHTHAGEPLPVAIQEVALTGVALTADLRQEVRNTTAKRTTNFNLRAITFYSAKAGSVHNVNPSTDADFGDATLNLSKWNGTAWEAANDSDATRTIIDFEPTYNYEIIGGQIDLPSDLKDGTTNQWYLSAVGVPDYGAGAPFYGSVPFINEVNLEAVTTQKVVSDGRAISYMAYNYAGYPHTNKMRVIVKHPAGAQKRFQLLLEHFR
jgi:hypothetical protein